MVLAQQHRHHSRQESDRSALRNLHLTPSQEHGHYSGQQHLPASEHFLSLSISEDRHKESRLCLALQAHKSGAAAWYRLGTDNIYGTVLSRAFLQPSRYFSDFLPLFFAIKDIPSDNRHSKLTWQTHSTRCLEWELGRRRLCCAER